METPTIAPYNTIDGVTFIGTQEIYLFCNTDGAEIHYTLNGSEPTKNSDQYTGPFTIDKNCVVKAIAVKEGMADSDVVTSGTFTKVTGIDEPSIRFGQDGKAYPANDTIPFDDFSKEYEYVLVPNYGAADDYEHVSVSGKGAVVQRGGNITFADKYKNAKTKGAAGLIIYNNQSGKFGAGLGDMSEDEKTIPLISTTREAGLAALNRLGRRCPEEISVIATSSFSGCENYTIPAITTVSYPARPLIDKAFEIILTPEKEFPERFLAAPELHRRSSIGKAIR